MGVLANTAVTINDAFYLAGHPKVKVVDVTLDLSSQGGLTNNIPASLFGMSKILWANGFRSSSSVKLDFGPNLTSTLVGTLLVAYDMTAGTDADRNNPADVTATVRGYVAGLE